MGVWFQSPGADVESGSPLDQYFLIALLCLGLVILTFRNFSWSRAIKQNPWLMLLIGYMLVSILWSDIPFISFKRWIRQLLGVVMAFMVASGRDPRQSIQIILRRTSYILIPFSLLLIKYFPDYGVYYTRWVGALMWIGVATHKSGLGRLCLVAAFFLIWTLIRRRQGHDKPVVRYQTYAEISVLMITFHLLKGSPDMLSATPIAGLILGLLFFLSLLWMGKRGILIKANTLVVLAAFSIGYGAVSPFIGGSNVSGFSSLFGRNETLTGRTDIWAGLLAKVIQRPILGYGYGGFWTTETIEIHQVTEAHNGYLEILMNLGFIGLLLFSIFLLSSIRKAHRELINDYYWGCLSICFFLVAMLYNVTEASFNSFTTHLTAILVFLSVSFGAAPSTPTIYPRNEGSD